MDSYLQLFPTFNFAFGSVLILNGSSFVLLFKVFYRCLFLLAIQQQKSGVMCYLLNGILMHTAIDWTVITPHKIIDSCTVLFQEIQSNLVRAFIIRGKLFMKACDV
jgi:hypothetical protein